MDYKNIIKEVVEKTCYITINRPKFLNSLNNETIMVAPAAGFYSTPNIGQNQVRIAYVLNENDLKTSIEILRTGLIEYCK